MDDLISRQAAMSIPLMPKEHRINQTNNLDDAYNEGWGDYQACISQMPSADAVEVVRCKECRNWACTEGHRARGYCLIWQTGRGSKDYCSEGRRKDGE